VSLDFSAGTCFYYPEDRGMAESVRLGRFTSRIDRAILGVTHLSGLFESANMQAGVASKS
jgi:hypothetical protein